MPGTLESQPWARLDLPNGECVPLEKPCDGGACDSSTCTCLGRGRLTTPAGRAIIDLIERHG